jgi:D-lactate dehydrogenase
MRYNIDMFDVYFYETFTEEKKLLKKLLPAGIKAGFSYYGAGEKNIPKTPPAPVISVRTQSVIPLNWAAKLKAVLTRSAGYDHITDYLKQTDANIACGYLPEYCSQAVAEHTLMLTMALIRKLPYQIKNFETFDRSGLTGFELKEKTVLVIGVGRIGSKVADIFKSLGVKVLCVDIVKRFKRFKYTHINRALPKADIVIASMNLTADNKNYFNYDFFKKAKKAVVFINIARGELSPVKDILKAIDNKIISGTGLDVYPDESDVAFDLRRKSKKISEMTKLIKKLSRKQNVILTPHNAFNTNASTFRKAEQTVKQLHYFLKNKKFKWQVPQNLI